MKRITKLIISALFAVFFTASCSLSRSGLPTQDELKSTELSVTDVPEAAQPSVIPDESVNAPEPVFEDISVTDASDDISEETAIATPPSVTLCLMGDIMCLSGQQYAAQCEDGTHDYRGCYKLIQPYFDECDYVIGNLETCLASSSPYSTQSKNIDSNPNCNAPADLLDSLADVGITHVVTANNHTLDADTAGIAETLAALDKIGIVHTGSQTPETIESYDPDYMMIDAGDIKIAVIAVTELINRRYLVSTEDMPFYVNTYSPEFVSSAVAKAREEGATFVIVYEHWGQENTHELTTAQRENAMVIAEAGADLIIGSHSHCVQPMEVLITSDNRNVPCFYSMGNLVSSMAKDINNDTFLVLLTLTPLGADRPGEVESVTTLVPCHVLSHYDGSSLVITPTGFDTGDAGSNSELAEAEARILDVLGK